MFSPKIKKVIFTILPALIVSGLVFAANIYYDLDLGKVIIDEVTRIVQDLEVLTGRIVGANEEEIKLGTTNDVFQVVRGGSAYYVCDSSGNCAGPQSYTYVSGTGTAGYLSKWTATSTLGNSIVLDNGTLVSVLGQFETQSTTTLATSTGFVGIATTTPYSTEKLTIYGNIWGSGNMILLGNITEATWQGNIIGIAYGGTGQDWSSVATGSLPYFSGIGVLGTLPLGNLNQILAASSSAPYWTDLTSIGGVTGSGSAGQVTFWTGTSSVSGDNNLFWDNTSKRLGIGTASPSYILSLGSGSDQTIWIERSSTGAGRKLIIQAGGAAEGEPNRPGGELRLSSGIVTGSGTSFISFYTAGGGPSGEGDVSPTEKMRIDSLGRVGIGITSPIYTLDVNGTLRTTATTTLATAGGYVGIGTTTPAYLLDVYSSGGNTIRLGASSTDTVLVGGGEGKLTAGIIDPWLIKNQYTSATTSLYIETSASPGHIILNPYGNVGVGTTAPAAKLEISIADLALKPFSAKRVGWETTATTTGTSTSLYAALYPFQRKTFYAQGLFWVFYSNGTNMVYVTSSDGVSWSMPTTVRSCNEGGGFSVWFDGTHLHYAYSSGNICEHLYYRRGKLNPNGTITWSAGEQLVDDAACNFDGISWEEAFYFPFVSVDSNGYPLIAYGRYWWDSVEGYNPQTRVIKSSTNDGTWQTAAGFYYILSQDDEYPASIIPLKGGKMLAIYAPGGSTVKARLWDGLNWSSETSTASAIQNGYYYSAVSEGDDVHLVFLKSSTYEIIYTKYLYSSGGFSGETSLATATSSSAPVITKDADNNLYVFWASSTNHIYYRKYNAQSASWESIVDWIDESSTGLTANDRLTSFYKDYGGNIGLVYMTGTASPYNIRFKSLILPQSFLSIQGQSGNVQIWKNEIDQFRLKNSAGYGVLETDSTDWLKINPDRYYSGISFFSPVYFDNKIGIKTTNPTFNLSFGSESNQTIGVERSIKEGGKMLTIQAGGAAVGASGGSGGELRLSSGISTGSGSSYITFYTATAGASGTTDNPLTEKMRILGSGNVGIGTTGPTSLLEVYSSTTDTKLTVTAATSTDSMIVFRTGATPATQALVGIDQSDSNKLKLVRGSDIATSTGITIDSSGNVGIGTTTPAYTLDVSGTLRSSATTTLATSGGRVGIGTSSPAYLFDVYSAGGNTIRLGASSTDTVLVGGGSGKLTAGTLDPQYRIGGKTFATYVPSMTGVREETTGVIRVEKMVEGKDYYQAEIDFNNLEEGSDLWLFSKVTTLKKNIDKLSVLLTPAGRTKVWYQVDPENFKLYFFAERPTTISYRLTAPRWDFEKWPNLVESEIGGMVINEDGLVVSSSTVYQYSEEQNDEGILDKIVSFVKDALEKLGLFIENGIAKIKEIVTEKLSSNVVVTNQLCLGQTCIDEAKLKELLEKNNMAMSNEQSTINNEQGTTSTEQETTENISSSTSTEATTSGEQVSEDSPPPTEATSSENSEQSAMNSGQETANNEQSTESSETTQTESSIPPQI